MNASLLLFGPGCPWYGLFEKFGPTNIAWCEETVCSWVNQPANTWSNLGYMIGAIYLYRTGMKKYGRVIFLLGLTSFIYHATNNFLTQVFDFLGMFLWSLLILNWNLSRLKWIPESARTQSYVAMNLLALLILFIFRLAHIPYQFIVPVIGVMVIFTEWKLRKVDEGFQKDYKPLFWMLFFLGIAAVFSASDIKRLWCEPENHWLQGHALWHLFGAVGITLSGAFYRRIPLCRG